MNRRGPLLAGSLALSSVLVLAVASPAAAEPCASFDTVAAADGVRTDVFAPGQFLVERADTQGPAAQAAATSLGSSTAYAGAPYPGDAALSAVALGGADPSALPVYAATQFPTKPQEEKTTPGLSLRASSERTFSSGKAAGGGDSGGGSATAGKTVSTAAAGCAKNGDISADAVTDSEAVGFAAGTLRIGRIQSQAQAKVLPDGSTELRADLNVGQVTVAGQTVGFTEKGLVFPGGSAPLPANPLAAVLAAAGITVIYVEPQRDPDGLGITAPGLKVQIAQNTGGEKPTVVTYTFGRARARATGEPGSAAGAVSTGTTTAPMSDGGSASTDSGGGSPAPTADADTFDASGLDNISLGATSPDVPLPATAQEPPAAGADGGSGTQPVASSRPSSGSLSLAAIYLALVVGAAAVLGGGSLMRLIGVRLVWT